MTKSEVLLGRLIEERLTPGADVAEVDRRIRAAFEEEWCVLWADMAGFSRERMEQGVIPFLCLVHELRRVVKPILEQHGGLLVRNTVDTYLVLFRRPPDALHCAQQLQRALAAYNQSRPPEGHLQLRNGIGFGRVMKIGDAEVFGVEVVHATYLGGMFGRNGEILVTDAARAALLHTPDVEFEKVSRGNDFDGYLVRPQEGEALA
jgi:adenylate cyclase